MIYPPVFAGSDSPEGHADHSLCSGRVPSLLGFSNPADASGTALQRLVINSYFIYFKMQKA